MEVLTPPRSTGLAERGGSYGTTPTVQSSDVALDAAVGVAAALGLHGGAHTHTHTDDADTSADDAAYALARLASSHEDVMRGLMERWEAERRALVAQHEAAVAELTSVLAHTRTHMEQASAEAAAATARYEELARSSVSLETHRNALVALGVKLASRESALASAASDNAARVRLCVRECEARVAAEREDAERRIAELRAAASDATLKEISRVQDVFAAQWREREARFSVCVCERERELAAEAGARLAEVREDAEARVREQRERAEAAEAELARTRVALASTEASLCVCESERDGAKAALEALRAKLKGTLFTAATGTSVSGSVAGSMRSGGGSPSRAALASPGDASPVPGASPRASLALSRIASRRSFMLPPVAEHGAPLARSASAASMSDSPSGGLRASRGSFMVSPRARSVLMADPSLRSEVAAGGQPVLAAVNETASPRSASGSPRSSQRAFFPSEGATSVSSASPLHVAAAGVPMPQQSSPVGVPPPPMAPPPTAAPPPPTAPPTGAQASQRRRSSAGGTQAAKLPPPPPPPGMRRVSAAPRPPAQPDAVQEAVQTAMDAAAAALRASDGPRADGGQPVSPVEELHASDVSDLERLAQEIETDPEERERLAVADAVELPVDVDVDTDGKASGPDAAGHGDGQDDEFDEADALHEQVELLLEQLADENELGISLDNQLKDLRAAHESLQSDKDDLEAQLSAANAAIVDLRMRAEEQTAVLASQSVALNEGIVAREHLLQALDECRVVVEGLQRDLRESEATVQAYQPLVDTYAAVHAQLANALVALSVSELGRHVEVLAPPVSVSQPAAAQVRMPSSVPGDAGTVQMPVSKSDPDAAPAPVRVTMFAVDDGTPLPVRSALDALQALFPLAHVQRDVQPTATTGVAGSVEVVEAAVAEVQRLLRHAELTADRARSLRTEALDALHAAMPPSAPRAATRFHADGDSGESAFSVDALVQGHLVADASPEDDTDAFTRCWNTSYAGLLCLLSGAGTPPQLLQQAVSDLQRGVVADVGGAGRAPGAEPEQTAAARVDGDQMVAVHARAAVLYLRDVAVAVHAPSAVEAVHLLSASLENEMERRRLLRVPAELRTPLAAELEGSDGVPEPTVAEDANAAALVLLDDSVGPRRWRELVQSPARMLDVVAAMQRAYANMHDECLDAEKRHAAALSKYASAAELADLRGRRLAVYKRALGTASAEIERLSARERSLASEVARLQPLLAHAQQCVEEVTAKLSSERREHSRKCADWATAAADMASSVRSLQVWVQVQRRAGARSELIHDAAQGAQPLASPSLAFQASGDHTSPSTTAPSHALAPVPLASAPVAARPRPPMPSDSSAPGLRAIPAQPAAAQPPCAGPHVPGHPPRPAPPTTSARPSPPAPASSQPSASQDPDSSPRSVNPLTAALQSFDRSSLRGVAQPREGANAQPSDAGDAARMPMGSRPDTSDGVTNGSVGTAASGERADAQQPELQKFAAGSDHVGGAGGDDIANSRAPTGQATSQSPTSSQFAAAPPESKYSAVVPATAPPPPPPPPAPPASSASVAEMATGPAETLPVGSEVVSATEGPPVAEPLLVSEGAAGAPSTATTAVRAPLTVMSPRRAPPAAPAHGGNSAQPVVEDDRTSAALASSAFAALTSVLERDASPARLHQPARSARSPYATFALPGSIDMAAASVPFRSPLRYL